MYQQTKRFILNTPEKYWVVVLGRHLHKSFWVLLLFTAGVLTGWHHTLGVVLSVIGVLLVALSIVGHYYTNNRPLLKLWDKYQR